MKPVQIMIDEPLLALLDQDEEVRRLGRSAVMRRAVAEYLRRRDEERIAEAYRRAYADPDAVEAELGDWLDAGGAPVDEGP